MNVRLVLATSPVPLHERYGRFSGAGSTATSFGLACLAASARSTGASVAIVEASAEGLDTSTATDQLLAHRPHVVGLTATTAGIVAAADLAAHLKAAQPDIITLIGGAHVTALPERTLNEFPSFDMAILGEGEITLTEILNTLNTASTLPTGLAGTAERRNGSIHINPPRPYIDDLDSLPLPAWSLIHGFPTAFHPSPARIRRWPCASVVLTRGCPNRCTFCDRSVFGNRCRGYSPDYTIRLLKDLHDNHGVREVLIEDDTFIIRRNQVEAVCQRLIDEQLDITWSCLGRADRVDLDLLKLMRRAGCWHISYGIESGDPEILKSVNKKLDLDQIRQALLWSRQAGLRTKGFFILGFPKETHESLAATCRVACELPLDDISVMQLTPFPGSDIFADAAEHGSFTCDWASMNTLNTVFVPRNLTLSDIEQARRHLLRTFYLRPSVLLRHASWTARNPRLWPYMFKGFWTLLRILTSRSGEKGNESPA